MSAASRAAQAAALRGMPKDKGRGIRLGGLGVRVQAGRVIVMGRDKGPVAGACAGAVKPGGRYGHTTAFVQFADGSKQDRYVQWGMEQGIGQEIRWFNHLADQAAADPAPSVPAQGRLTGMPLIQLAADCQERAAAQPVTKAAAKRAAGKAPTMSAGVQAGAAVLTLVAFLLLATFISAIIDGIFLFVQHTVTYPAECAPSIYGPPADSCSHSSQVQSIVWSDAIIYGIAVLMWLIGLATFVKQGMSGKKAA